MDNEATSRLILQNGALKTRTTFIPLNKISASKMSQETINLAQNLVSFALNHRQVELNPNYLLKVGKENCVPALSLINYDRSLQSAMEFIFGHVFICKDINVAKKVCFHNSIRKKCVTLDGDSTDPNGTFCHIYFLYLNPLTSNENLQKISIFVSKNIRHYYLIYYVFNRSLGEKGNNFSKLRKLLYYDILEKVVQFTDFCTFWW